VSPTALATPLSGSYEKYLEVEGAENSRREFEHHQNILAKQSKRRRRRSRHHRNAKKDVNRYLQPLTPFKHPADRTRDLMPADTFDTIALVSGFVLD